MKVNKTEMKKAANIVFYDDKGNFLLQNRKGIARWGEDYHFFGGHVEEGEIPEETVKREIKEEMNFELKNFKLFKRWPHYSEVAKCNYETFVFVAPMPLLEDINVIDGKAEIVKFEDIPNLKMLPGYKELLKEIFEREVS